MNYSEPFPQDQTPFQRLFVLKARFRTHVRYLTHGIDRVICEFDVIHCNRIRGRGKIQSSIQ
jgi:hypothetical protein